MAPGFLLLLTLVLLSALAPVVGAVAIGCLFFPAATPLAATLIRYGAGGAALAAAAVGLSAMTGAAFATGEALIIVSAGFSVGALTGGLFRLIMSRRRARADG